MEKTLILGIGNILMTDDGVGVKAIEDIASRYVLPANVKLLDGGVAGLNLIPAIEGFERLIIVDALIIKGAKAGTIRTKAWKPGMKSCPSRGLAHGIGVPELLNMALLTGCTFNAVIVGMAPEKVSPGLELTKTTADKLPALVKKVLSILIKDGHTIKERSVHARKTHGRSGDRGD